MALVLGGLFKALEANPVYNPRSYVYIYMFIIEEPFSYRKA